MLCTCGAVMFRAKPEADEYRCYRCHRRVDVPTDGNPPVLLRAGISFSGARDVAKWWIGSEKETVIYRPVYTVEGSDVPTHLMPIHIGGEHGSEV